MAQPSVVREPSMEEILASIRQIIESNEPGAGRGISPSLPPVYAADDDEGDSNIRLTVDETYAGVEFPEPMTPSDPRFVAANSAGIPEVETPARAMSLADVAARVRAASERGAPPPQREAPPLFRGAEAPLRPEEIRRPTEAVSAPVVAPPPAAMPAPAVTEANPAELPRSLAVEPAPQPVVRPVAEPAVNLKQPAAVEESQGLISQSAGLQIARSFEELALAIDGAERRSLDEIAEDMLRPMLREWLDDNLPTLVERLVREEIERVARGPRR